MVEEEAKEEGRGGRYFYVSDEIEREEARWKRPHSLFLLSPSFSPVGFSFLSSSLLLFSFDFRLSSRQLDHQFPGLTFSTLSPFLASLPRSLLPLSLPFSIHTFLSIYSGIPFPLKVEKEGKKVAPAYFLLFVREDLSFHV